MNQLRQPHMNIPSTDTTLASFLNLTTRSNNCSNYLNLQVNAHSSSCVILVRFLSASAINHRLFHDKPAGLKTSSFQTSLHLRFQSPSSDAATRQLVETSAALMRCLGRRICKMRLNMSGPRISSGSRSPSPMLQ